MISLGSDNAVSLQCSTSLLDVPVDEACVVNGLNGENTFGNVEAGRVLGESFITNQQRHHVAAGQEFHNQIEILGVLEAVVQLNNPVVVGEGKEIPLGPHVR